MLAARHRVFFILSMNDVEPLQRIGWLRAIFDSVWNISSTFSSTIAIRNATTCLASGSGMPFFRAMKAKLMYRGLANQSKRVDAFTLPVWVLNNSSSLLISTRKVLGSYFILHTLQFRGGRPLCFKNGFLRTLLSMSELSLRANAASMKALRCGCQKHAYSKKI